MYKILKKEILNKDVELMDIHAPYISRRCQPGQFLIVMAIEDGERIPLTIADFDREKETVTIIYQVMGASTKKLSEFEVGDELESVVGPLGQPAHKLNVKRVIGIAGGVGAAPMYPQLKGYHKRGIKVDLIIGGRTKDHILIKDKYEEFCDNIYVATDDGSEGVKGFVTTVLQDLIDKGEEIEQVIAIGPLVMMKAVVNITKQYNIPTSVSLNPIMIDGTGMCGACRLKLDGKTKFACIDGPDFNGFDIDFDELIKRQVFYKDKEQSYMCRAKEEGVIV